MTNTLAKSALTTGLLAGYGGKTTFTAVDRAGFPLKSSHLQDDSLLYYDEWLNAHNGGGQELAQYDDEKFTRLYAGGVVSPETLAALGISENQIIEFLRAVLVENPGLSRLTAPFEVSHADWSYRYVVLDNDEKTQLTIGKESIFYKEELVFAHGFLLSPVIT